MLLYEYQVRDEFARVRELAQRVQAKFDAKADPEDLLHDSEFLGAAYKQLCRMLPNGVTGGNFTRHVGFMETYLKKGQPDNCRDDIDDICSLDLPALEKAFRDWAAGQQHYDAEFAEKLGRLLAEQHLDSAVRKAFVLLKERLVRTFGTNRDLDGRDLVNQIFGSKGILAGRIPEPERESMRNFLDGLYGVFRNRYDHGDVEPDWSEAEAVLSTVNWVLRKLDTYPSIADAEEPW